MGKVLIAYNNDSGTVLHDFLESCADEAKQIFIRGARRAKGTTQEMGMTESFFANPFGPVQREEQTRVIIDKVFDSLFKTGVPVGNLHTRLAVPGMEHDGPALAAKRLFELLGE